MHKPFSRNSEALSEANTGANEANTHTCGIFDGGEKDGNSRTP